MLNRVMLITGSSRGIGRFLADHYCRHGYRMITCGRSALDTQDQQHSHYVADLTKEDQLRSLFAFIKSEFRRLDILINNLGVSSSTLALVATREEAERVFATNVATTISVTREALRLMRKNSFGRIVNISSIHVPLATVGTSIYSAAKASVEQYGRVVAREVSQFGITVNSVGLSYVKDSGMVQQTSPEMIEKVAELLPIHPLTGFESVVHCVDFFISENAKDITGQVVYTSGAR